MPAADIHSILAACFPVAQLLLQAGRISEQPKCCSATTHTWQLCEQPASDPATFWVGIDAPSNPHGAERGNQPDPAGPKPSALPSMGGLFIWARIWSHHGHGGLHVPGAGDNNQGVMWLPGRNQGDMQKNSVGGTEKPCLLLLPAPPPRHPKSGDVKISAFVEN